MARSRGHIVIGTLTLTSWLCGCHSADQDRAERRRDAAKQACEAAVLDRLASRTTATFKRDDEHIFFDSTGGAGVTGVVAAGGGARDFACILKSDTDSTWTLTAARLMN